MFKTNPEKLAATRKMGRETFVWRYGVLGWGVSTAILFAAWTGYQQGWAAFLVQLPLALVLFPLTGILWGRCMWWYFERSQGATTGGAKSE
jgi:hypothetical protein